MKTIYALLFGCSALLWPTSYFACSLAPEEESYCAVLMMFPKKWDIRVLDTSLNEARAKEMVLKFLTNNRFPTPRKGEENMRTVAVVAAIFSAVGWFRERRRPSQQV